MRTYRSSPEHLAKRRAKYQEDRLDILKNLLEVHKADPRKRMLRDARKRAKSKGLDFDITLEDIIIPKYCPISLLELKVSTGKFNSSSPTLDRINNEKGYIKGNVAVISNRANAMKKDAYYDEIYRMLIYMESGCLNS